MLPPPLGIIAFIIVVAMPAYYINKWLLQRLQPRKSLPRLVTHILICVVAGFLYAFLYIQLMLLLVN
jgi:Kef-type K+ transport system membrane component KefB